MLNHVARVNGHEARFVALEGHVISEILTADGWRVADANYGVVFPTSFADLERHPETAAPILQANGYTGTTVSTYVDRIETRADNRIVEDDMSPRLAMAERLMGWLKWAIPIALAIPALWLSRVAPGRRRRRGAAG